MVWLPMPPKVRRGEGRFTYPIATKPNRICGVFFHKTNHLYPNVKSSIINVTYHAFQILTYYGSDTLNGDVKFFSLYLTERMYLNKNVIKLVPNFRVRWPLIPRDIHSFLRQYAPGTNSILVQDKFSLPVNSKHY